MRGFRKIVENMQRRAAPVPMPRRQAPVGQPMPQQQGAPGFAKGGLVKKPKTVMKMAKGGMMCSPRKKMAMGGMVKGCKRSGVK
jgi:hypothetical protein